MRGVIPAAVMVLIVTAGPANGVVRRRPGKRRTTGMTVRERARFYRHHTFGRGALARSAAVAGYNQLRGSPREWGGGPLGYVKRFGSAVGQHAVRNGIAFGVGAWRHEDPHYYPSGRKGFWPRTKYAVKSTFVTRRYGHRRKGVAAGRLAGDVGGGIVSKMWQPHTAGLMASGLESGGIAVGADVGMNMAREFLPHRKHPHRIR